MGLEGRGAGVRGWEDGGCGEGGGIGDKMDEVYIGSVSIKVF